MKVALFTTVFAPSIGGVESQVATLARGLAGLEAQNFEVTVITTTPAGPVDDSAFPFAVVRRPSLLQLVRLFRPADVLHLAGPSLAPLAIALLLRKPVVLAHHGFQAVCPNGQYFLEPQRMPCSGHFMAGRHEKCWECNRGRGTLESLRIWALTFFRRWLAARATANVVPSRWLGEVLRLPRTTVIGHGVAPSDCRAARIGVPRISFLGRLVSSKGVSVLLRAVNILRQRGLRPTLQIIGDGPERPELEKTAAKLGLNGGVSFLGSLPDGELDAALDGSIAVVPSLGGEVFGLVAAQNMMAGRAVVVSDLGSLAEVVGDGGLIFPAGDAQKLAECLEELSRKPALHERLRQQARQRATEHFTIQRMVREHADLHAAAAQRNRRSP